MSLKVYVFHPTSIAGWKVSLTSQGVLWPDNRPDPTGSTGMLGLHHAREPSLLTSFASMDPIATLTSP